MLYLKQFSDSLVRSEIHSKVSVVELDNKVMKYSCHHLKFSHYHFTGCSPSDREVFLCSLKLLCVWQWLWEFRHLWQCIKQRKGDCHKVSFTETMCLNNVLVLCDSNSECICTDQSVT